jgi:N-acetyl sugar amidotransferase
VSYDPEKRKGVHVFDPARSGYRICTQCVMDSSDPEITFDESGVCSHCHDFDRRVATEVIPGVRGRQELARILAQIKKEGEGKKYDCILGLSGGVDSTYVAYLCKKFGLRPLAVHLDNGWNSEIAVRNIHNIVQILGLDLHTRVLDWEEFRSLQVAFLRASTPDSEIPTDHAIVSTLYETAVKNRVRWIMDGSNVVTEIMSPATWSHGHGDWTYIKHLNDTFGGGPLKTYPHYTYYDLAFKYGMWHKLERFPILNYVEFNKLEAMKVLERELNWVPYGGKHYESIYTRFYQGYILPQKFGFDKRRSHLSCLVRDNRMSRDAALAELQQPALDGEQLAEDRAFAVKKLGLSEAEFEAIMSAPRKTFWDYPSDEMTIGETAAYRRFWRAVSIWRRLEARYEARRLELARDPVGFLSRRASRFGANLAWPFVIAADIAAMAVRNPSAAARRAGRGLWRISKRSAAATIRFARPFGVAILGRTVSPERFERMRQAARRISDRLS